jgi:RimJ/RimL family protein N-acetyltransferase
VRLETERLLLRPIGPGDLDDFAALHAEPEVTRYIRPLDRDAAAERIRVDGLEWEERGHGILVVAQRRSGEFLGRAGIKYWPQFGETELGWALRRAAWGKGYATEAARAVAAWGFSNLDVPYLTAMIRPENDRSARVAGRLGMIPGREDVLLGDPVVVYMLRRPD